MKRTIDEVEKKAVAPGGGEDGDDGRLDYDVPPYQAAKSEELPASPVYSLDFTKLSKLIQDEVDLLLGPINNTEYRSPVVEGLIEEVKKRSKGSFPEKICIALIGEMAAGKSSVINSILSTGMIARQGDGGGSCTWVTQEFCYTLPKQTSPFAAEIHFYEEEGRHAIIAQLLADYYHASARDDDDAEPKDSDHMAEKYSIMKTSVDDGVQPIWLRPFVSYIKFGLKHPLLQHGITLLDVPGLTDSNKVRVTNALSTLRRCTHGIVVTGISRASDESFLRSHCTKGFWERGLGRSMLVLTHADEIDDHTEVRLNRKEKQEMDGLQAEEGNLEQEVKSISKSISIHKAPKKYEFMGKRELVSGKIRSVQARMEGMRIAARSRSIEIALQKAYVDLVSNPYPLRVFCVGNKAYKKHQAGYSTTDIDAPTLSVKATNFPQLREHLYLIPAEGTMNVTKNLVETQLPALLNCFDLFICKTHMARKGEIEALVMKPLEILDRLIHGIFEGMHRDAKRYIMDPYKDKEWDWTREAKDLCQGWAIEYNTGTHLAFLKNNGYQNFLVKAMAKVYARAAEMKGKKGTPKQRIVFFEKEVTKLSGVHAKVHDSINKQFQMVFKRHGDKLTAALKEYFRDIVKKFDMLCSDKEAEHPGEVELRREKLRKNLVLAREKMTKEIEPLIKRCLGSSAE
ncbi:hypothetical protein EJ03DRAFT_383985 [Teratosphaeria nubilosa]|uniref:Dynamin N-terminal domain-containing protein n=1 Tax=Teratosphaeria nubilosa TaxID=161662 RepID=A0A6G1L4K8_9PEZI|nr:hypothetical protein EJ03DRAFT_383985 [Teratosphaeria nubilosa]